MINNFEENIITICNNIDHEYISMIDSFCEHKTNYIFDLNGDINISIYITKKIFDTSNHIRMFIDESIEENKLLNNEIFLMWLNDKLYDKEFYLDIITNIEEFENTTFNALILLLHHPAYIEGRLMIKKSNGGKFYSDEVNEYVAKELIIGDYIKIKQTFIDNNENIHHIVNFGDTEIVKTIVVEYDDIKNTLEDII